MARRALGLRARGAGRLAFEINGRPKTEPGLPARSPLCFVCLTAHELRRCCGSDRHLAVPLVWGTALAQANLAPRRGNSRHLSEPR